MRRGIMTIELYRVRTRRGIMAINLYRVRLDRW